MALIDCTLVHHTGTIIRFRPAQLTHLPDADVDVTVGLPHGRLVQGHFRRNLANPNVSGRGVVGYIKRVLSFAHNRPMLIDIRPDGVWDLYELDQAVRVVQRAGGGRHRIERGRLTPKDLATLLEQANRETNHQKRLRKYAGILRPPCLRRLILGLMGASCQVQGCTICRRIAQYWGHETAAEAIVDVHHIEALANVVDHSPNNLSVLCANHHQLIHRWGPWAVTHQGDNVILRKAAKQLRIVRDLSFLSEVPDS